MKPDAFRNTTECRCHDGYSSYSILAKLRLGNTAVTLLELGSGPKLRVSLDNCANKLIIFLNEDCSYGANSNETTSREIQVNIPLFNKDDWHRLAIEFSESAISVYINCTVHSTMPINRTSCRLDCNSGHNNKIIGPLQNSCQNGGNDVSLHQLVIYICAFVGYNHPTIRTNFRLRNK